VQRASAHARVFDHAGAAGARAIAPARVAFRVIKHVGLRIEDFSRLNGWPVHSPINASPTPSQMSPHDAGASVVRYTFTARDFHSLLFAGFAGALITSFITGETTLALNCRLPGRSAPSTPYPFFTDDRLA
jgi:hypothetical protein